MVAKKRASKRQTLHQKYKIQKRVKEHHKKLKKGILIRNGKKNKSENRIPNDWPYKGELLQEIAQAKEKMEIIKQRQKDKRAETMKMKRLGVTSNSETTSMTPSHEEAVGEEENDDEENGHEIKSQALGQNSRRAFLRDLRKIVESSEVILHVLDARDPIGTKSHAIEEMVLSHSGKKLVYILNKADLVPRHVLIGWLTYLRQYHPTIPFKCNTQLQRGNLGHTTGKISQLDHSALLSNQTIGAEELLNLLKNYCRLNGTQTKSAIAVGIVGFPNVGKSSLINSLTRTRAVNVSSVPGYTKQIQEVILDKNIRLLDSPGVVFADGDTGTTILRNCVNVDEMVDLISPIEAILERCPATYLMQLYSIPRFQQTDCMSFLSLVARSTGKLKRGGIPNLDAAAKGILHDWNNGKIKYYCKPPSMMSGSASSSSGSGPSSRMTSAEVLSGDTKIVTSFGNQIDFDNLQDDDIKVLDELSVLDQIAFVGIDKLEYIGGEHHEEGEGGAKDDDDDENMSDGDMKMNSSRSRANSSSSIRSKKNKKSSSSSSSAGASSSHQEDTSNAVALRLQQKKLLKKVAKDTRRSQGASAVAATANLQDYSFETDFQY